MFIDGDQALLARKKSWRCKGGDVFPTSTFQRRSWFCAPVTAKWSCPIRHVVALVGRVSPGRTRLARNATALRER